MRIRGFFLSRRYTLSAFIIFLLLFAITAMSLRVKQRRGVEFLDAFVIEVCAPLQNGLTFLFKSSRTILDRYLFFFHLQRENAALRQRLAQLQEENQRLREMAASSERLRALLAFREKASPSMIAAEVIGQDPSSWFKSITINRGEKDGIQKGMAVICPEGVIGRVLKTASRYAVVLLVTDYNSAVDAIIQGSRAKAIVEGRGGNECQLKYLLRTEEVAVGDAVVTSGLDGTFPKGLMVGQIKKVQKVGHGVFQYAEIVPSVDLTRLEEVLIISESPLPLREEKEKPLKMKTKPPRAEPSPRKAPKAPSKR
jgi:rod shape-determining protein MreC